QPALTPILVKEPWVKELEGLSLKNVSISVYQDNKKKDERFGEALFTDSGLSGPIILDMSKSIGNLLALGQAKLFIDFKPALDFNVLDKRLLRDFEENRNKAIKNILPGLLPRKLIPVIMSLAQIDPEKKGNSITKDDRKRLRLLLKEFPLTIKSLLGFNKAIITAGGIPLKEIDPKTMRSRIIRNLFFAGEIIDLDGPTGGYNLQVCWSTGYLAGEQAARAGG
ncbi:MAG TPA: aminoacetone oxidase family FAD-binding enzyme, partial [Deltaproteobacteria bacterium]|nr:aminoacetone oxidase family FAD-binding enzyme [Deltaproteobacteria bacterium]